MPRFVRKACCCCFALGCSQGFGGNSSTGAVVAGLPQRPVGVVDGGSASRAADGTAELIGFDGGGGQADEAVLASGTALGHGLAP